MRCDEVLAPALANRVFLYRYAWRLFAVEPDEPLSEIAVDGQTMESCAVFAGLDSDMVRAQEYIAKTLSDSDCFRRLSVRPSFPLLLGSQFMCAAKT